MAQVIRNQDGTYILTLTPKEQRAIARASTEPLAVSAAKKLETVLTTAIQAWYRDYLAVDAPVRMAKFDALGIAKQDQVDAILNGG